MKKYTVLLLFLFLPVVLPAQIEMVGTVSSKDMNDQIGEITSIYSTPKDYIVILDRENNRIFWVDQDGQIVKKIGKKGNGNGEFSSPKDIFVDNKGNIYVADTGNDRIQVFNQKASFLFKFGESGNDNGELNDPRGLFVSDRGYIYVADTGNDRIQVFNRDGVYVSKFGTSGDLQGEFDEPTAITIDKRGNMYVCDRGNNRIQIFDRDGILFNYFGREGDEPGQFDDIKDIFYNEKDDRIYVLDKGQNGIHIFQKNGSFYASFGTEGEAEGEFDSPDSLMISAEGHVYIADTGNNRIQIFSFEEPKKETSQPVVKKEIIYPDQKQMLAVFKFENVGKEAIELDYGQVVAHNLNKEIALANFFDVRDKSRVEEVLDKLELKNKSINLEQAVKAGKELTLESAIIGSVSKLKDTIDIDVRVVNILNGKDICTFYEKISEESQIRETCKDIVKKIMLYYSENNDFNLKTPANLKTKSEIKSITLSWKPNQEKKLAGYYIYRSESADGDYEYVGETDKSLFTDQDLDPGKTYYYKVASVNIFGYESELSIFNSAQPLPPPELDPVQNVEIISEAVPVELKWDKMKEQIAGYRIYRTDGEGEEFKKLKEIKDNSYRDEDVQAFKTYQYKVTAFNNDIESKLGSSSALTVVVKELWESLKEDNFRKGPSSKTEIIKKMPKGEKFYFSGEKKQVGKNNAYLKIKTLDGTEGWFWMASAKKLK